MGREFCGRENFKFLPRIEHAAFLVPHAQILHLPVDQPAFLKNRGVHKLNRAMENYYVKNLNVK